MAKKVESVIWLATLIFLFSTLSASTMGKTIYVDADAAGANDGTSWTDAYNFLQNALADADVAEKPVEIRVAQGTYRPNQGLMSIPEFDWRTTTFQLINGITLKGGYAGLGEPDPNARDIEAYETILSGDLDGDDVEVADPCDLLGEPTRAENSYNVVTGSGADATAVLDGFTITGGNADDDPYSNPTLNNCTFSGNWASYGGGMSNDHSNPTLDNCTFRANSVDWDGGGMYNSYSSPTLTKCTFIANWAYNGGGMENFIDCNPTVINCTFSRNSADENGGGMHNEYHTNTTVTNCTFSENSGNGNGGGMYNHENSDTILTGCIFVGNSCGNGGGGMWNSMSNPTLFNCTFSGNLADFGGGMVNVFESSPILTNCTFSGNSADDGGGMDNFSNSSPVLTNCKFVGNSASWGGGMYNSDSSPTLNNCTFSGNFADEVGGMFASWDRSSTLTNCILWGNTFPQIAGVADVSYTNVQGGWEGAGNIDAGPLFAEPGYWADVNDPNIVVEPNTPNAVWIDGDYHLKSEIGRWDQRSQNWVLDDVTSPCIDAGDPNSDWTAELWPHGERINMGAFGGTQEASMSLSDAGKPFYIQWLGHSTVKVWTEDCVVYVDPERLTESLHDATLVCVTHTHGDHYSASDIAKVSNSETQFIAPPDVVQRYGSGRPIAPGQTIEFDCAGVTAVPAYNTNKPNHPKSRNWVGFIIELGSKRIYVAGDTDLTDEMKALEGIDAAILPAGGTYTMNAVEAAEATQYIKPELAIPYHWGRNVGTLSDAETFAQKAVCAVKILTVGETISSDNWPQYSPLIAHWKLDETEGSIAFDSEGNNSGTLNGNPLWRLAGGKVDGALEFDGTDDYISSDFVLNPADGPFSVFAWIKGGAPGQAVISQTSGANWLCSDASAGNLMTELRHIAGRVAQPPLLSQTVITDGDWHRVGFVWDGSNRILYADGAEVATDTQIGLATSDGGLYIGAGKNLEPASFFSGLIDDVRIYNEALSPEDIETLAH
ncbi:MAG: MBL fold metallo-hydrolase [Planctomycetota bacterium]